MTDLKNPDATMMMGDKWLDDPGFKAAVLSHGCFLDEVTQGALYKVETWTVRLNSAALNDFHRFSLPILDALEGGPEWQEKKAQKEAARAEWEAHLLIAIERAGTKRGFTYSQIVSEVFGVCVMQKLN